MGSAQVQRVDSCGVVLASVSPRRRVLLGEACERLGLRFSWMDPGVDDGELALGGVSAPALCCALAYLKARSAWEILRDRGESAGVVVGADTVCEADGRVLGKAADADEARAMLRGFVGGVHRVVSGVALIPGGDLRRRRVFFDEAEVRWGMVSDDAIEAYVASGQWRGKAGAYNLDERLGAGWAIEVQGDPTTVVGLPMRRLEAALRSLAGACAGGGVCGGVRGGAA